MSKTMSPRIACQVMMAALLVAVLTVVVPLSGAGPRADAAGLPVAQVTEIQAAVTPQCVAWAVQYQYEYVMRHGSVLDKQLARMALGVVRAHRDPYTAATHAGPALGYVISAILICR